MTRQRLLSIGLVSAVLVVAGCSSSDSSSPTTPAPTTIEAPPTIDRGAPAETTPPTSEAPAPTTPPTSEAPAPTTPPTSEAPAPTTPPTTAAPDDGIDPDIAADMELARTALLTIDDFPEGWVETPNDPTATSADDQQFRGLINDCLGDAANPDDEFLDERKVETGKFGTDGSTVEVNQKVILAPTLDDALASMASISNEAVPTCYASASQAMFEAALVDPGQTDFPPGLTIGTVEAEAEDYGYAPDEAVTYFVHIPAALNDETVDVYVEVWFMRSGRALSQMTFSGTNELFPQGGIDALTAGTLDRLALIG